MWLGVFHTTDSNVWSHVFNYAFSWQSFIRTLLHSSFSADVFQLVIKRIIMAAEGVDLDTVTEILKKLKGSDERGALYVSVTWVKCDKQRINIKFPAEGCYD